MGELEKLTALSSNVRLYVPSTFDVDQAADNSGEVREAAELFSEFFGGATAYQGTGCWKSPAVGLVTEAVTIVEAFCNREQLVERMGEVIAFARGLRDRMSQEAVALEVDRRLYLV